MSLTIQWQQDCQFNVETSGGFSLNIDADNQSAPCPTEVLLSALGTCSATDVVMGLQEQGVVLKSFCNQVTYTLTESSPRLYETVNLHFVVDGDNVSESQISEIASDAINKYCHVCLMLQPKIAISHTVEIVEIEKC